MKRYIICLITIAAVFTACNDDFLDRAPETAITSAGFFKSVSDVEAYINGLYGLRPGPRTGDWDSDNVTYSMTRTETWIMLRGSLNEDNVGGWDTGNWGQLRGVNYLLENLQDVSGNEDDLRHFIGIARFFRANFYIDKINRYSDVPWTNKALDSDDPDIFKAADPRALVADSIVADLEYAARYVSPEGKYAGNRTRINKHAALSLLSRFCLYEGTFRKYHPELNLQSTAGRFLERAATAAEEIMTSGQFEITGTGKVTLAEKETDVTYAVNETNTPLSTEVNVAPGYQAIFHSMDDLGNNKEVILWQDTRERHAGVLNHVLQTDGSLSRSLMETFLMEDGSRFQDQPGYPNLGFTDVFKNRDPRFAQVFAYPGFRSNQDGVYLTAIDNGGYGQIKFYPLILGQNQNGGIHFASLVIFRYGEVLLNYAEAKAELGTLTQEDLDNSINRLRDRVEMPHLSLNAGVDPILAAQYPNVDGANKGVLLEIRRERRVELACEGLRLWDLHRWYVGSLFGQPQEGVYISAVNTPFDITGDGVDDVAVATDEATATALREQGVSRVFLLANRIYLTDNTPGHIKITFDRDEGKSFVEPKYYYRPIPKRQMLLNPALTQPYGW
ncbi:MAG: RagB/SusD family nutrient uptake outer membrane protein [Tannerella sp.]|jgi:hypothetical protein|nr:RagB/SusD family nutrient uptake outer membrane protein [Tannerella sp.]